MTLKMFYPANMYLLMLSLLYFGKIIDGILPEGKSRYTKEDKLAKKYLAMYGYMNFAQTNLKDAVSNFQRFARLNVSGKVDIDLLGKITQPRCGMADIGEDGVFRIQKYYLHESSWEKESVTWRLVKGSENENTMIELTLDDTLEVIREAFQVWHKASYLEFQEIKDRRADIAISFENYMHGDPFPFDGEAGLIAHAFYPRNEGQGFYGDIHFDDGETYKSKTSNINSRKINLLWAAIHEIGHSLGIMHSIDPNSVMYPWYNKINPVVRLHDNDIRAVKRKYSHLNKKGTMENTNSPETESVFTTIKPEVTHSVSGTRKSTSRAYIRRRPCPNLPIKAIIRLPRISHRMFIEENKLCYFFDGYGIKYGPLDFINYYPRFRYVPSIDASFTMRMNESGDVTIIFAGKHYYLYRQFAFFSGPHQFYGNKATENLTNPLNFRFPKWLEKIDAAMRWYPNQKVYIFADAYFWKYDDKNLSFYPNYPQITRFLWRNLPETLDAAYSSIEEKKTLFISGDKFYLFNDGLLQVSLGFPKHISEWLNCGELRNKFIAQPTLYPSHIGRIIKEP